MEIDFEALQDWLGWIIAGLGIFLCAAGIISHMFPYKTRRDHHHG